VFGIGPATRIYLAAGSTDMRKGFEGLYGLVRDRLSCDPLSGHVFLFSNAQRNRLKLLFWDGSGLWVCAKRMEKGRFRWPEAGAEGKQNHPQPRRTHAASRRYRSGANQAPGMASCDSHSIKYRNKYARICFNFSRDRLS
jgi:transposase